MQKSIRLWVALVLLLSSRWLGVMILMSHKNEDAARRKLGARMGPVDICVSCVCVELARINIFGEPLICMIFHVSLL